MSTTGTIEPRKLNIPIKNDGASGTMVRFGHSTTSSTSSTEKQKRSRPARKMQYCRSGSALGSSSSCSASGDSGSSCPCSSDICLISKLLSCLFPHQPADRAQKLFVGKRLHHVTVCALLLGPELVTLSVFGTDHRHRNSRKLSVALQFTARLKAVTLGHDHVHQDKVRPFHGDRLLQARRIVNRDRHVAGLIQHVLHQPDFGR